LYIDEFDLVVILTKFETKGIVELRTLLLCGLVFGEEVKASMRHSPFILSVLDRVSFLQEERMSKNTAIAGITFLPMACIVF